ncbi:hypothetical protein HK100_002105 [Physocladia obscura]|uniref:Uncharacterized protein n=1 Tax=Physocladia obscura TaxID=109957 RepID=A0AAD5T879_9FUNG|nr:hypothetical protein HK100_002105 [Physocladia obscura]
MNPGHKTTSHITKRITRRKIRKNQVPQIRKLDKRRIPVQPIITNINRPQFFELPNLRRYLPRQHVAMQVQMLQVL